MESQEPRGGKKMKKIREVIEEIPGFVTLFEDGSVERHENRSSEAQPTSHVFPSQGFIDGVASWDVTLEAASELWARVFVPQSAANGNGNGTKAPLVLFFHGGGFCLGSASWRMYHTFCSRMAAATAAIWVSVNYRLAPEHRLPRGCEDCIAALAWLNSLADCGGSELESHDLSRLADFGRCFLAGDSVGGNMAHQVAIFDSRNPGRARIVGMILLHPGFVREERSGSELANPADLALVSVDAIDKAARLALPEGSDKDYYVMNPWIPSVAELTLPPALVIVGEMDLFYDRQLQYCGAMKEGGQDLECVEYKKMGHCFILHSQYQSSSEALDLTQKLTNFMNKCILKSETKCNRS